LVPYFPDTAPSQRYRIEQWLPYLEQQGIATELVPFANAELTKLLYQPGRHAAKARAMSAAFLRRVAGLASVRRYDAVVIHRGACILGPAVIERAITLLGCPIIYDFDDAIYLLHTSTANRHFGWLKFPGKTSSICRMSRHVVVGNSILADYARRYNPQVTVIPSSVDTNHYQPAARSTPAKRIVVGWTGSSTSQTYLEMFAPVLRDIIAACDLELRVHSDREPVLPGIPFVWRPWKAETEVEEVAEFDIGIMPMPDDKWTRGKCAMKALLYMATGIPTICSAVGTNCEVIQHGKNGLLAATPDDWSTQLKLLATSPELRAQLGAAGRLTVEEKYSMLSCATAFADVVHSVAR
jgi:glycosyltransferase involved in cell wall biosynthesis